MSLKAKLTSLVIMAALIYAALTWFRTDQGADLRMLFWSGLIASIIGGVVWTAFHYFWRVPGLGRLISSVPNLRGSWEFTGTIIQSLDPKSDGTLVNADLNIVPKTEGFLVIRQSDSHIKVTVLWKDAKDRSEITADAPTSYHLGALAFAGTYKNEARGASHGFGAWLTAVGDPVIKTDLRYRTDSGETGQLTATNRVARSYKDFDSARKAKPVQLWEKVLFALLPM